YKARDTRLERTVAVKVLPSHMSASPEVQQRFEREAKTISQLSHPHICALYDVGREGETEYLVMEYLEGETLSDRLAKGPVPLEQTLRYGVEIADALDKAHRQGIVHRDLKPGNVMLTKSGVKLLDFGLAKAMAPAVPRSQLTSAPTQQGLTQEGTILGTFQYMAPEQLEGREADARADIWALGCLLYEMATGRPAFSGSSQASLISAIMTSEPAPMSTLQAAPPGSVERLVRRCLAKDPERRYQSARDAGLGLEEIRETGEGPSEPSRAARGRREAAGWLAAALLLLALLGALVLPRRARGPAPGASIRFTIPPPPGAAYQVMPAISPDGRRLVFVATTSDGRDLLWIRPLEALESRMLEGTDGAAYPFWSPDSRFVAFFAQQKLKRIDVLGGAPQILCDAPEPRGGSWGSRGTIVFSAQTGGQISRVAEGGGKAQVLPHLGAVSGQSFRWPSFLPDGSNFLYFAFGTDPKVTSGVYVASLESQETTRIASTDGGAICASTGYVLYPSGGRLMGQRFDAKRRRVAGAAFPVMDNISFDSAATAAIAVSASGTGLLACQTGGSTVSRLLLYDRSGRELQAIGPAGSYWEPTLSPDGRRLAVPRMDPEALQASIWTIDLERGHLTRLSSQVSVSSTPLWSPDGRRILYSTYPSGEVYVRDADGAEPEKLLFKAPAFAPLDDWSRDGRYILYDVIDWRVFHTDVWLRDLKSGESRPILQARFNQSGARLSPDGRRVAYESEESGVFEIFVKSFPEPGERRQISLGGGRQPRWRGDGKELFYVSPDRKIMAVDILPGTPLEPGAPQALFQTRILPLVEARNHFDAALDGQRFVVNSRGLEDAQLPITIVVNWEPEPKR
ncbi:MAG: protein kinase, partial [Acidobacteriota bacterium]